jgi:hypothetical protein
MYVEKSFDWGKTWKIQRYFAVDCDKDFPGIHKGKQATNLMGFIETGSVRRQHNVVFSNTGLRVQSNDILQRAYAE